MNTLWGWGRASWAGCGPDVRRGGQTLIMGYSADKSPLIGHLAGPIRRLKPLGAQRQEKCGPNHLTREGLHATTPLAAGTVAPAFGQTVGSIEGTVADGQGLRRHATLPQSWIQRENWEFETHRDAVEGPSPV